jgi:GrpB-like predicted nucleotidyltransferase (UPF0157 family)
MPGRDPFDASRYKEELARVTIGPLESLSHPIEICDYDAEWPIRYVREEERIRSALGATAVRIEHVGSTSVPGLPAKPVIDIVLEVSNSAAESQYVADLESVGYRLRIREPEWFEHRLFKGPDANVNLHVFSAGCEEVEAMLRFRDRLRKNPVDRERYSVIKRESAALPWKYVQQYADAKTAVVQEILARAERAREAEEDSERRAQGSL